MRPPSSSNVGAAWRDPASLDLTGGNRRFHLSAP
jgi:hypothetical protein